MAVYQYTGTIKEREEYTESGTIVADSEKDARAKLETMRFQNVRLKKLGGIKGLIKSFTADIR